jgi:hypothetical protein
MEVFRFRSLKARSMEVCKAEISLAQVGFSEIRSYVCVFSLPLVPYSDLFFKQSKKLRIRHLVFPSLSFMTVKTDLRLHISTKHVSLAQTSFFLLNILLTIQHKVRGKDNSACSVHLLMDRDARA